MINELLKIHRNKEELDFTIMWKEAIFIFDSNVILDLYRLPKSARNDLMSVFENIDFNERIWIGFQVALEFLNNRYEAIAEQKNKFNDVKTLLNNAIEQYEQLSIILEKGLIDLKLKKRHSLIDPDNFINSENNDLGKKHFLEFIDNLDKLEEEQVDVNDTDEIKDFVFKVFKDKIGSSFSNEELITIYSDGEKRYKDNIPPGFKDIKKDGFYKFKSSKYIRKYGDLLLWKEIIHKAKTEKLKYVVLVTGDGKEDWWFKKRGQKLGPRKELLNEIYNCVPELDTFYMYDTATFLKYAKSNLDLDINESSITEIKDLAEIQKEIEAQQERYEEEKYREMIERDEARERYEEEQQERYEEEQQERYEAERERYEEEKYREMMEGDEARERYEEELRERYEEEQRERYEMRK